MGLFSGVKAYVYEQQVRSVLKEVLGDTSFQWDWILTRTVNINHGRADRLTPEETVLYTVGEYAKGMTSFDDGWRIQIYLPGGSISNRNAEEWFWVAQMWRDDGQVSSTVLNEFLSCLGRIKSRWPQLFTGEKPIEECYWEVHFNTQITGILFDKPAPEEPIDTFTEFSDAVKFVVSESVEDYWWHTYDLPDIAKNVLGPDLMYSHYREIPEWENNEPPKSLSTVHKRGHIGHNNIWNKSAECLLAMPKSTYDRWRFSVENNERLVYVDSGDQGRQVPIDFYQCWLLRKVCVSRPIDLGETDN